MDEISQEEITKLLEDVVKYTRKNNEVLNEFKEKGVSINYLLLQEDVERVHVASVAKHFKEEFKIGKRVSYHVHIDDSSSLLHVPDEVILSLIKELNETIKLSLLKGVEFVNIEMMKKDISSAFASGNYEINIQRGGKNIVGEAVHTMQQSIGMIRMIRTEIEQMIFMYLRKCEEDRLDDREENIREVREIYDEPVKIASKILGIEAKKLSEILDLNPTIFLLDDTFFEITEPAGFR